MIDAVYAFAYALDKLRSDVCGRRTESICAEMAHFDGGQFYKEYLLKVDFEGKTIKLSLSSSISSPTLE